MTRLSIVVLALAVLGSAASPTEVSGADAPTEVELKAKFKQRRAALNRLKDGGKVGETAGGYLGVVRSAGGDEGVEVPGEGKVTVAGFVRIENDDRHKLYRLIGERTGEPEAEVAEQAGFRNFHKAKPNHWLELPDGTWVQKKDLPRG